VECLVQFPLLKKWVMLLMVVLDYVTAELPSVLERNENVVNIYVLHLLKSKETRNVITHPQSYHKM